MSDILLREIMGTDLVPLTFRLRYEVWSAETKLIPRVKKQGVITDSHDAHARHWVAFDEKEMVGAARMCVHEKQQDVPEGSCYKAIELIGPLASINRLIVARSARNRGIAKKLDLHRIQAAKETGANCTVAGPASDLRIHSLEKLGFLSTPHRCKCTYKKDFWLSVMVMDL